MGPDLMPVRRMSPQLRQPANTRAMMVDVMVALVPALAMGAVSYTQLDVYKRQGMECV